jgi:hypothetical protein
MSDDTTYLVKRSLKDGSHYIAETDLPYGRDKCIADIVNGHHDNIVSIYAITPSMGSCRDVTREVAEAIYRKCDGEGSVDSINEDTIEFLRANGQDINGLIAWIHFEVISGHRADDDAQRSWSTPSIYI